MTPPDSPKMAGIEPAQFFLPDYSGPLLRFDVVPTQWTHLASARFGPGRPCSWNPKVAWTGDAFRYDIFHHLEHRWYGLRWTHGGGTGWLIEQERTASSVHSLLLHIAQLSDEAIRWDYCHQLAESMARTAHAATIHESERWEQALFKKQITIRHRNGQRRASIMSPIGPSVAREAVTRLNPRARVLCCLAGLQSRGRDLLGGPLFVPIPEEGLQSSAGEGPSPMDGAGS